MEFYEYIKIRGMDSLRSSDLSPESFEVFQGLGAEALDLDIANQTPDPNTGLLPALPQPITAIDAALWEGQNKLIRAEGVYAGQLEKLFRQQQQKMPLDDASLIGQVIGEVGEFFEELLASFLGGFATGLVGAVGTGLEEPVFLVSKFLFEILIGYAWDKLKTLWQKGADLCVGIIEEDNALLVLPASLENYILRKDALSLHTEMFENVLNQIESMQNMLDRTIVGATDTKGIVKALKNVEHLKELPDIDESLDKLEALITTFDEMKGAVEDLKWNNEEVEVGGIRVSHRNRYVGA